MHTFRAAARSLTLPNKKMTAFLRDVVIGQASFFRDRKIKLSHGFTHSDRFFQVHKIARIGPVFGYKITVE